MRTQSRTSKRARDAGAQQAVADAASPDPRLVAIARALGRLLAREHARSDNDSATPRGRPERP